MAKPNYAAQCGVPAPRRVFVLAARVGKHELVSQLVSPLCLRGPARVKYSQMSSTYFDQVSEAASFLRTKLIGHAGTLAPRLGIVLGSGLGAVADAVASPVIVPYADIADFPQSTFQGHPGRIVAGHLGSVPAILRP